MSFYFTNSFDLTLKKITERPEFYAGDILNLHPGVLFTNLRHCCKFP